MVRVQAKPEPPRIYAGEVSVNGLLLPVILFAILYLVNQKLLMGRYSNGLVYNVVAYTLAIVVSGLAVIYLLTQVFSFFGIQLFGEGGKGSVFLCRLKSAFPCARSVWNCFSLWSPLSQGET
jgi:hypothetical protein